MTVPTQPVTIDLAAFGGPAVAGVKVTARLLDWDYTSSGLFVSTKPVSGLTDATGVVVLEVFPNAPAPDGLGTRGTLIRFEASPPQSKPIRVETQVPNAPSNLADLVPADDSVGVGAAQAALIQINLILLAAQAALAQAQAARDQAAAFSGVPKAVTKNIPADGLVWTLNGGAAITGIVAVVWNGQVRYPFEYTVNLATGQVTFNESLDGSGTVLILWI